MSQPAKQAIEKTTHSSAPAEEARYFNEYASGIGYLNGIREFGAEGKPTRYAAQIAVIQGPENDVHYEYHDLIIASETVLKVVLEYREAIDNEDVKVIVRFKMANPRAKAFIYKQGKHVGELGAIIGGFLTRILSLKINGEQVYEDTRTFDNQDASAQAVNG
ncbi:MAG: DUF3577 domain-containing protein [Gammaproteobacteria bacterium]|nr:DUF3577 domain-containing protein [Gammaproteobacteria bacterium]